MLQNQERAAGAPGRNTFRPWQFMAACLVVCLCHLPLRAQPAYGVPAADRAGRAPGSKSTLAAWQHLLEASRALPEQEKIAIVNGFFNRTVTFADDQAVWGVPDYWATPREMMARGSGDCEDFAVAKYVTLRMLGLPRHSLRLMYVHADTGGRKPIAHMVLGYYPHPGDEPRVLDNMVEGVRPLSARPDLALVYSFNTQGLWVAGEQASAADPVSRLSRWRGVLQRMMVDGTLALGTDFEFGELTAQAASR